MLIYATAMLLAGLLAVFLHVVDVSADALLYPTCVAFAGVFGLCLWTWRRFTGQLFDPYALFLVAAFLFNGGHALLEILGFNDYGVLDGMFSPGTLLLTLYLVMLSLGAFHLGALLAAMKEPAAASSAAKERRRPSSGDISVVGWGLLLFSAAPATVVLKDALSVVLHSGYFGLFQREVATGVGATPRVLAAFVAPAALFLLAGSKGRPLQLIVSGVVIVANSTILFFLGSRAVAVMPLVAYAWLWHRAVRPLPNTMLASAAAVLLFLVFPLVRLTRGVAGGARLSLAYLYESFLTIENPLIASVHEMGATMKTVAHTFELVPALRGFDYGVGYLYGLLTVLPNVFWDVHPTIARGLAASWLTRTVAPVLAELGGGLGFSFIAEAYLNFGWFGPLALLAIGWLYARLVLWADRSGDPAKLAMVCSFVSFFLFFSRGESGGVIRPLFWNALVPYLATHAVRQFRTKLGVSARRAPGDLSAARRRSTT